MQMLKFCLFTLSAFALTVPAESVCIHSIEGKDVVDCLNESLCCASLSFPIESFTAMDISIWLLSDVILDRVVYFENFKSLTIKSNSSSRIFCSDQSAGIYIQNSSNIIFSHIVLENCSMLQNSSTPSQTRPEESEKIWCALYIYHCFNLIFDFVVIRRNRGTGVVIYNTKGNVTIKDSIFEENSVNPDICEYGGGGGLVIEFTRCQVLTCISHVMNATYFIQSSNFTFNSAYQLNSDHLSYDVINNTHSFSGIGRGGGAYISVRGNSKQNTFIINYCKFINNTAGTYGGGLYLSLNSGNNSVNISGTDFVNNTCQYYGGGGIAVQLSPYIGAVFLNNRVFMDSVNFVGNTARFGGGLVVGARREDSLISKFQSVLHFNKCIWQRNYGEIGSAVDSHPNSGGIGILPVLNFCDCIFQENCIRNGKLHSSDGVQKGQGTLVVTQFTVKFAGRIEFSNNTGTALYLLSGLANTGANTTLQFIGNRAHKGGAIALYGLSIIYLGAYSFVFFKDNSAETKGGAIYVNSLYIHGRFFQRSCFLQTLNQETNERNENVTIRFEGNRAEENRGNSIYASSLLSCAHSCNEDEISSSSLDCLGRIENLRDADIKTYATKFSIGDTSKLSKLIPGKSISIPMVAFDELNESVSVYYDASLKTSNSISLADKMLHSKLSVSSKGIVENNTLVLSYKEKAICMNFTAIECPPGHVISDMECDCEVSRFQGVWQCNRTSKTASISHGFWIGLCDDGQQCTGYCTTGFCQDRVAIKLTGRINDTHKVLCSDSRKGKLCGKCTANHSVYYHSESYKCGEESLCNYGILFYILSELLPLTVIFILIIAFNISFTTGTMNGIVLYAQIFHFFVYNHHTAVLTKFREVSMLLYTVSNLSYFNIDQLSFCLWKGATTLDIIAFKYVTVSYALLIILSVYILSTRNCYRCRKCLKLDNNNTVINSLAVFLVMCYSQCARISFSLLSVSILRQYGNTPSESIVTYGGELRPFEGQHIPYAVIALLFLLLVVIPPPVLLIIYPLGFKLLAFCRLREIKLIDRLANIIPMQVLDLFQGGFNDNYRFISGVYFLYRVIPVILFSMVPTFLAYFAIAEVFLVLALTINAVLQPYKERRHNIMDSLLFANLALINAISLISYETLHDVRYNMGEAPLWLNILTSVQVIFVYLPLLYLIFNLLWYTLKWMKEQANKSKNQSILLDSTCLPPLYERLDSSHQYHQMKQE